ncbi:MAG: hypothetical protein A2977_03895 [Alphaproteobacteria bacterium RIFCSPLOWO2_01_FULL_45_8]|nr:MAG: hypothetical protein A2977_03895 [Alphaproteobacteria bacterium RIFCSPLOWO2_01_FULL_45_8]
MLKNVLFILGAAAFFYGGLGSYALLNNNEGLYAQIAWEMLESGNWVIPHLNGVPYIEKPPLLYWLVAGSFKLFGKNEWAARLVPATFGFLTCLALYVFAGSFHKRRWGQLSAFVLATCCGFIVFSRMVFFDVVLTFFLTASALCFYKFYDTEEKKYVYGLSCFMAAAVLTKGLVPLALMGLLILVFLVLEKNLLFLRVLLNPGACGVFFMLAVPWHVAAALQEKGFLWFYFVNEQWMRFLDKRVPRDYYTGPVYYYFPRVLGYMVPWTFLAPFFVRKKSLTESSSLQRFLGCWFLTFFVFFSLSKAKANYYMVVGMPPLALWLGMHLSGYRWQKRITVLAAISSATLMVAAIVYVKNHEDHFSTKGSLSVVSKETPLYLYKRFEELSTLPFYVGRPIPIIESESHDLWYGKGTLKREDLFLSDKDPFLKQRVVYVMKKDQNEFLEKQGDIPPKIIYDFPGYSIFYHH